MDYLVRAKKIGHDISAIEKGDIVKSQITVKSLDEFKDLFGSGLTNEQRALFSKQCSEAPTVSHYRGNTNLPMMRVMDHVFGNGTLSKTDAEYTNKIFPIKLDVASGTTVTINSNVTVGPNGAPYVVNAGTLIFDGGSISAISTSLTIQADNLIVKSGGDKPYHVGILGDAGKDGGQGQQGNPYTSPAKAGSNASAPTPGICTGASNGGNGTNGATGNTGGTGDNGKNGASNLPATITIKAYDASSASPFVLFTQSGAGGNGGKGGTGGTGQDGGHGGHGCDSGCEGTDGGNGGDGGQGGEGGKGGKGGNGAHGYDIQVSFPGSARDKLQTLSQSAPVGDAGVAGDGGAGGTGGAAGSGGKHKNNGQKGSDGGPGKTGSAGLPGDMPGAPGNFNINYT